MSSFTNVEVLVLPSTWLFILNAQSQNIIIWMFNFENSNQFKLLPGLG